MNNEDVAGVLSEIAELLELKGESRFRVRAYEQAARSVEFLAEDIEQVYREGRLQEIPYVGAGIAGRLTELLETGRSSYLEELEESVPPGTEMLLQVPGIGPKTALLLYRELGVDSIEALKRAAEEGLIRQVHGMGPRSEENILSGIRWLQGKTPRLPLGEAFVLAGQLLDRLRQDPFARNLVVAGSYRRMSPTVGDLDIMGTSDRPETVIDLFTILPQVRRVMSRGGTMASVLLNNSLQADLRIVPHESFGSLLQHFTGSKEHNVQLRDYALSRDLSISEYQITNLKTGWRIPCATEEQVYQVLDMQFIPPEIREGTGEIDAARHRRLPRLLERSDIRGDLHVHSQWSDGRHSLEEMARAAEEMGYGYLAVTDHSPMLGVAHGLSRQQLHEQWRFIENFNAASRGIKLLKGCEVDIRADGSLDLPDSMLQSMDIVLGSVHSAMRQPEAQMTERVLKAMRNPYLNILCHPTGRLIQNRPPFEIDMEAIIRAAADLGVILEIDGTPDRLDLDGRHARRAVELGAMMAVSSDAHQMSGLGYMHFAVGTARRGWVTKEAVVNTRPLSGLLPLLRRRRRAA